MSPGDMRGSQSRATKQRIEDLDSKNGTFVSDRRVDSATRLVDGASIRVGSVRLTFTAVRNRGSTETEPGSDG